MVLWDVGKGKLGTKGDCLSMHGSGLQTDDPAAVRCTDARGYAVVAEGNLWAIRHPWLPSSERVLRW